MSDWRIERVGDEDAASLADVQQLFIEYHAWLGAVVNSARLTAEISSLPGPYAAPRGRLFLARNPDGEAAGCIGVRHHEGTSSEIKRLYVRANARGSGLGRALIEIAIEAAREIGYEEALVSTLPDTMPIAASMYERLGFEVTEPFFDHSYVQEDVGMRYLRLPLTGGGQ